MSSKLPNRPMTYPKRRPHPSQPPSSLRMLLGYQESAYGNHSPHGYGSSREHSIKGYVARPTLNRSSSQIYSQSHISPAHGSNVFSSPVLSTNTTQVAPRLALRTEFGQHDNFEFWLTVFFNLQVLEYLSKKGYSKTEATLRREAAVHDDQGRPITRRTEDHGAKQYALAYRK
jgi:hypothetical protein